MVSLVGGHVEQLAKWSCEMVRDNIKRRGDQEKWLVNHDGLYLIRGFQRFYFKKWVCKITDHFKRSSKNDKITFGCSLIFHKGYQCYKGFFKSHNMHKNIHLNTGKGIHATYNCMYIIYAHHIQRLIYSGIKF